MNGTHSKPSPVTSSVPQGTVLGPILFLILISDIDEDTTSKVTSFADDTRVMRQIKDEVDTEALQKDLTTIYKWQETNNMLFNDKKFELIRYGKNRDLKNTTNYRNPLGQQIMENQCVKDLGIHMGTSLEFREHLDSVCLTARKYSGWILRTFKSRDTSTMKTLWNSMVLPRIDYCSQLWSPTTKGQLSKMESLQRNFTSYCSETRDVDYWQRLKTLKMYSIERRFERYRIIYIWKMIEQKVPNYGINTYHSLRHGRLCQVPPINKRASQTAKTLRESSLLVRGAQLFNSIPVHVRNLSGCSVESFKSQLDKFLSTIRDEPHLPGYTQRAQTKSNSLLHMSKLNR